MLFLFHEPTSLVAKRQSRPIWSKPGRSGQYWVRLHFETMGRVVSKNYW
jgi:hypothetical protein